MGHKYVMFNFNGNATAVYDLNKVVYAKRSSDTSYALWLAGMSEGIVINYDDKETCDTNWDFVIKELTKLNGQK